MEQKKKRIGLLGFVGSILLIAVLAALASSTWATPEQRVRADEQSIPQKSCDKDLLPRGESAQIQIGLHCPITDTWISTVLTDSIDANLKVTGVGTTKGSASWAGQNVTFTIGTMLPGSTETLRIYVEATRDAVQGHDVYNMAYLSHVGWTVPATKTNAFMCRIAYVQHMPLAIRRYQ